MHSSIQRKATAFLAFGGLLVCLLVPATGWAEDIQKASDLNAKAIEAYKAKDYLDAIELWLQAQEFASAKQRIKLHKNLGLALMKLERNPEAWHHLSAYMRRTNYEDKKVGEKVRALGKKLARTFIKVTISTRPLGSGLVLPPGDRLHRLVTPLVWWFPPGEYAIELSHKGYTTRKEKLRASLRGNRNFMYQMKLVAKEGFLDVLGGPKGSKLLVDGKVAGDLPFSAKYPPGDYSVEVIYPTGKSWKKVVSIKSEKTHKITVPTPGKPVKKIVKKKDKKSTLLPWITIASGGALVIAGGALHAVGASKTDFGTYDGAKDKALAAGGTTAAMQKVYQDEADAMYDSAKPLIAASYALYGLGGAAIAGGVVWLILTSSDGNQPSNSKVSLFPMISPDSTGFAFEWTF